MPKPGKLQNIISNSKLADDLTIEVGGESFTLGELRAMDTESEGGSTAELESRESNLIKAQAGLAETLERVSKITKIPLEKLLSNDLDDVTIPAAAATTVTDDEDPLAELDPKVRAALDKRYGASTVQAAVDKLQKELADTRKALGIALKVNMDDYYQNNWERVAKDIPEGVKLDLNAALKYADENNIREKGTGRYNLHKAVRDLTADARLQAEVKRAREEGEKLGREKALIDAMPRPGQQRSQILKPPVDDKGRTHTIEHQLNEAMNDNDIVRMISGPMAEA